jgi:hypothetical protein
MIENKLVLIEKLGFNWVIRNKIDGNYEITIVYKELPSMLIGLECLSFQDTVLFNCIDEALKYIRDNGDCGAKKLIKEFSIN